MFQSFLKSHLRKVIIGSSILSPGIYFITSCYALAVDVENSAEPHYHWENEGWFKSFDHAAMRRGYQVYKEVCSSCHSMRFLCYRHLIGQIFTEKQAKLEASNAMIYDGPDNNGEYFLREGILSDVVPPPYANDKAAQAANNGSLPPDLSLIVGSRHGHANYLFQMLIGYQEEIPPGQIVDSDKFFNPWFPGGVIAMPPPLNDGAVEYPDGTPATTTQMAADITEFLTWSYWRAMERQKQIGMFISIYTTCGVGLWFWAKRYSTSHVQTQRVTYKMKSFGMK